MSLRRLSQIGAGSRRSAVHTYPARRVCEEAVCLTVLSIYNRSAFCWLHEPRARVTGSVTRR